MSPSRPDHSQAGETAATKWRRGSGSLGATRRRALEKADETFNLWHANFNA
jgi:hypothetical protein